METVFESDVILFQILRFCDGPTLHQLGKVNQTLRRITRDKAFRKRLQAYRLWKVKWRMIEKDSEFHLKARRYLYKIGYKLVRQCKELCQKVADHLEVDGFTLKLALLQMEPYLIEHSVEPVFDWYFVLNELAYLKFGKEMTYEFTRSEQSKRVWRQILREIGWKERETQKKPRFQYKYINHFKYNVQMYGFENRKIPENIVQEVADFLKSNRVDPSVYSIRHALRTMRKQNYYQYIMDIYYLLTGEEKVQLSPEQMKCLEKDVCIYREIHQVVNWDVRKNFFPTEFVMTKLCQKRGYPIPKTGRTYHSLKMDALEKDFRKIERYLY